VALRQHSWLCLVLLCGVQDQPHQPHQPGLLQTSTNLLHSSQLTQHSWQLTQCSCSNQHDELLSLQLLTLCVGLLASASPRTGAGLCALVLSLIYSIFAQCTSLMMGGDDGAGN
jgi:hypothetical protein